MARQRLNYKLYPVSTRVDPRGVYYGLVQGNTTEPETSLREIMAYKKITAFDPAQVVRLTEDIVQGALELTALDGRPRAISSLLKTFLGFDKAFPTADARVTDQKLVARVRLLKDMRLEPNMDDFTLVNEAGPQTIIDTLQWYSGDNPPAGNVVSASIAATTSIRRLAITGIGMDVPDAFEVFDVTASTIIYPRTQIATMTGSQTSYYTLTATWPVSENIGFESPGLVVGHTLELRLLDSTDIDANILALKTAVVTA